jgi:putative addiction module antidote
MKTKIRRIGNSLGVVLPREAVRHLRVKEGDEVYLSEAPHCTLRMTPEQEDFARKMAKAEDLMNRYRNALSELAK